MLFFSTSTWEPENSNKIIEHFKKLRPPAGVKIINQWVDISGGRYFILYETEDAKSFAEFNLPWSDICYIETSVVMESTEFIKLMSSKGV
ncbi:DUF3303 domain-containing protein [Methanolobus halotolerans]|uniref:DUF3303 domain-containing protein n=1 Tax=Methanolobus halotolerans TaxID=2052935 RepID=A0A4E0PUI5_9EURY|nr:DUF3303 family protein [Methanolobus halotolerans]TGC06939.1 hypothetical protein CUN85_12440 [Methanolobus halotolerans]